MFAVLLDAILQLRRGDAAVAGDAEECSKERLIAAREAPLDLKQRDRQFIHVLVPWIRDS